ncbi:MAG: DinB family protein [bacterium]
MHHRGQLSVMMRQAGLVVEHLRPELRGDRSS